MGCRVSAIEHHRKESDYEIALKYFERWDSDPQAAHQQFQNHDKNLTVIIFVLLEQKWYFHQSVPFLLTAFGLSPLELSWTWAAAMLSWSFAQCKRMTEKATLKNIRRIQNNMNIMSFLVSCHIHMDIHMISYWIFNDIMIFICGVLCWTEAGDCTWQS